MLEQGEIVLIPVPFTDLSSKKQRPVIVISNTPYHAATGDMVVVAMTSNPTPLPYSFTIDSPDLDHGKLNHPGTVRVDRIYSLAQGLIARRFGKVNSATLDRIRKEVQDLMKDSPLTSCSERVFRMPSCTALGQLAQ